MSRRGPLLGPPAWAAAGLVAVLVALGVHALRSVLQPGDWVTHALAVSVAALLTATGVRTLTRSRAGGTVAGALIGTLTIWSLYAGPTTSPGLPVPTPEGVRRVSLLVRAGIQTVVEGAVPVEVTRGLGLLVVVGVLTVTLLTDLLAGGLARPALSGLPVVALWAVPISFYRNPSSLTLLLGGTTYLLLLALGRPRDGAAAEPTWRAAPVATVGAVLVTAAAVALGPVAAASDLYGSVRLPGSGTGPGTGPVEVSLDLDMRASLTDRSPRPLLSYRLDGANPGPLRLYTMTRFDGRQWLRNPDPPETVDVAGTVLWPQEPPEAGDGLQMTITVGDLDQDRLPIPLDPRAVQVEDRWAYDPIRDEVLALSGTTRNLRYTVDVSGRGLTDDSLRALATATPAQPGALDVPQTSYTQDITALAQEITADARTPYDQALALQSWYRDGTNFRYDTSIPPARTDDAVWDFLTERSGYCVQYATAMTVMARSLGLPARMAVGFLPGRAVPSAPGEFVVTGRQAHTWPEIHFDDVGWVRFEPTPAQQTDAPPTYADPLAPAPGPTTGPQPTATASGPAVPTPAPTSNAGQGGQAGSEDASTAVAVGLGGALVLGLVAVGLVSARRRRQAEDDALDPERAWLELSAVSARNGSPWSPSATPRQVVALLTPRIREGVLPEAGTATQTGVGGERDRAETQPSPAVDPSRALQELATAVTTTRYTQRDPGSTADELRAWVDSVEGALTRDAHDDGPPPGRRGRRAGARS